MPDATDHYFSDRPGSPEDRRPATVRLGGRQLQVLTAGGVFANGRVDTGTQVLLRTVDAGALDADVLDLGCGWGPIALTMALGAPTARVWAIDVNPRAVELTRVNATAAGLDGIRAVAPEEVPDDVTFTAIWSNPPIRIGKPALHGLLGTWLGRLAPGGTASLVVQRHLGADSLQRWISEELGMPTRRLASAKGFRVLRVSR